MGQTGKSIRIPGARSDDDDIFVSFRNERNFREWSRDNKLYRVHHDGRRDLVAIWNDLEDGQKYLDDTTLRKRVSEGIMQRVKRLPEMNNDLSSSQQVKDLEDFDPVIAQGLELEALEKSMEVMAQRYGSGVKPICVKQLRDHRGRTREYDAIVVAENCVQVTEVRHSLEQSPYL